MNRHERELEWTRKSATNAAARRLLDAGMIDAAFYLDEAMALECVEDWRHANPERICGLHDNRCGKLKGHPGGHLRVLASF